jgi:hypothetical protein
LTSTWLTEVAANGLVELENQEWPLGTSVLAPFRNVYDTILVSCGETERQMR